MQHIPENYCADFLELLRNQTTCDWCKHPRESVMRRIGLCGHCNRIRKGLEKLEKDAAAYRQKHGDLRFDWDWDLRVQRKMVEGAQVEGRKYGKLFDDDFFDTTLEYEFRFLSKKSTGKDLFFGLTGPLNYSFGVNQRKYLFYLLSLMSREILRKNRRGHAMYEVATGE